MNLKPIVFSELNPPLNTTVIASTEQLHLVSDFISRVTEFVCDVETNITKSFVDRKIRTIQIGNRAEQYVIDLLQIAGSTEKLCEQGSFICPEWAKPVIDAIRGGLDSGKHLKLGVNLQFDYQSLLWSFGVRMWNLYDCFRVEQILYSGKVHFRAKDFWAMDDMLARYTGLQMDKSQQKTFDLESPLTEEQINYAGFDCRAPFAIRAGQSNLVTKFKLTEAVRVDCQSIPAFGDMYLNGIYLNPEAWLEVVADVEKDHAQNVAKLDEFFLPVVGNKNIAPISNDQLFQLEQIWQQEKKDKELRKAHLENLRAARRELKRWADDRKEAEGEAAINYGSSAQLIKALRKMGFDKKKLPSTNDRILETLNDEPVIAALQNFRTTQKLLDNYGKSFLDYIDPTTGRVHSNIDLLGAESGRTSSSNPNLQNIPSRSEIGKRQRGCFRARPGYVFVSVDMSGAELRILAELSQDPIMVSAFQKGWDVHSCGAEIIFGDEWKNGAEDGTRKVLNDKGEIEILPPCAYYHKDHSKCKCPAHKKLREHIKTINFGIAYGMEAKKLADDLHISKKEAQALLEKWRKAFKVAWEYLTKSGNSAKMTMISRTMCGRVRYYTKPEWDKCKEWTVEKFVKDGKDPHTITSNDVAKTYAMKFGNIERQGKNSPIQGTNADILKLALGCSFDPNGVGYLWHQVQRFDCKLVLEVHDETDWEVREDQADEFIAVVGDAYERAAAEYMKKVKMEYEANKSAGWTK